MTSDNDRIVRNGSVLLSEIKALLTKSWRNLATMLGDV